jgi:hypothetical protein
MNGARIALLILAVLLGANTLVAALANANLHGGFFQQLHVFMVLPWGRDILIQSLAGLAGMALVIFLFERTWLQGILLCLPLLLLGHAWSAAWLALRLPKLAARLSRPDWPGA